ncbi:MAG: hypothetical protein GU359_06900 [Desulfurococcales archaeon]|nr:hypothetical protein [Desulfurococcales archaeon]
MKSLNIFMLIAIFIIILMLMTQSISSFIISQESLQNGVTTVTITMNRKSSFYNIPSGFNETVASTELKFLKIAIVSDNISFIKYFINMFINETETQNIVSFKPLDIEKAFEESNVTILDLNATLLFVKKIELVKKVFWSEKLVVFITEGSVDPIEEIYKSIDHSELPFTVLPLKEIKIIGDVSMYYDNKLGVEIAKINIRNVSILPVFGFKEIPKILIIKTWRFKGSNDREVLRVHYYTSDHIDFREIKESIMNILSRNMLARVGNIKDNIMKKESSPLIIKVKADSGLEEMYQWSYIGSWSGSSGDEYLTANYDVIFDYAINYNDPSYPMIGLYRVFTHHRIYAIKDNYILPYRHTTNLFWARDPAYTKVWCGELSNGVFYWRKDEEVWDYEPHYASADGSFTLTWLIPPPGFGLSITITIGQNIYHEPGYSTGYSSFYGRYAQNVVWQNWGSIYGPGLRNGGLFSKYYIRGLNPLSTGASMVVSVEFKNIVWLATSYLSISHVQYFVAIFYISAG